jgi:NAD(P)-dependent dehydrogenase (short-subunit alcohol dehydrogenase family)
MQDRNVSRRTFLGGAAALGASAMAPGGLARQSPARAGDRQSSDRGVALITGTSSGFGNLIALTLARHGYQVYASMRHVHSKNASAAEQLERVSSDEGLALEVIEIDVRSERSVERGVHRVLRQSRRIDVLVNNAGIFYPALLETLTIDDVEEVFDTNVFGQLRMNRAVLPAMRARGAGLVVQITSGTGRLALPFQGAYNGAKWAMEAMTQVSRYELSQSGVDVVIVEPGPYPTDLIDNARIYYRDYLRGLTHTDARRRGEYGELATRVERELNEEGPDPQEVADAVAALIAIPAGQRPTRTLVGDQISQLLGDYNASHQQLQNTVVDEDLQSSAATSRGWGA